MTIAPLGATTLTNVKLTNPVGVDSDTTLARLAQSVQQDKTAGLTLAPEPESGLTRGADTTQFADLDEQFAKLGPLVKRLKAAAERYQNVDPQVLDYQIEQALKPFRESNGGTFPGGISADLDQTFVESVALKGSGFSAGDSIELEVSVLQAAEFAGLFLEFGANAQGGVGTISLGGSNSAFVIEIAGPDGTQELSFSSGQSLSQIAAAIQSFSQVTGISAVVSGSGVRLESSTSGGSAFTSVAVVNDGGITDNGSGNTLGVYGLEDDNFDVAQASGDSFNSTAASNGVRDDGADAEVLINGEPAEQIGGYWVSTVDGRLDVALDLDEEAILAAGGTVSLGTVGKTKGGGNGGRGPDGLGAPGQLKKAERVRVDEASRESGSEPVPADATEAEETDGVSRDAGERLQRVDVEA